jgi:hypothetical protein
MNCGRLAFIASLSTLLLPFGASQGLAQSDFESLEKEIREQRLQLEKQNRRLEELERMLREAKARAAGPGDDSKAQTPTLAEEEKKDLTGSADSTVLRAEPGDDSKAQPKTTQAEEEKKDRKGSTRSTVFREPENRYETLSDADFPKSVPLFGSDWRFSYGGYVKLDVITDFDGTGDPYQFTTATIPVPGASTSTPPGGYTKVHARESRFNFEVRNTDKDAPFTKLFFEFDFFDEGTTSPRWRHAYLQYGDLIVGQTWTTLSELRSLPFLVDFSYGDALYGGRASLVRWQHRVNDRFDWAVGLEDFNDKAIENPNALNGTARSWTPLFAARGTYDTGRALFTLGGALAQLRWDGNQGVADAQALQWSLVFGTRIYLGPDRKHFFVLNSSYGDGSAGNIISLAAGKVPGGVLGPDGSLHTLKAWSLVPALHFQLTPKLSTNLDYAWSQVESSSLREPDLMKGGTQWHVNLIYDLTKELRVGGEYMVGTRKNVNDASGQAKRLQFMMMYTF